MYIWALLISKSNQMNRTFYVPKDKEQVMHQFVKECQNRKINYSNLLVQFMEDYINQKSSKTDAKV